ncbi:hypothetical protein L842_0800 [Mycobacterium intracellulare MIN_052511_1280]|nr:hypothetical protein L842_0800 [Mycobacterium intracellulare MIN_052511_1280]
MTAGVAVQLNLEHPRLRPRFRLDVFDNFGHCGLKRREIPH